MNAFNKHLNTIIYYSHSTFFNDSSSEGHPQVTQHIILLHTMLEGGRGKRQ